MKQAEIKDKVAIESQQATLDNIEEMLRQKDALLQ
jgi:CO dehydrogenase/acetyl-CoA synthase beta subunit